MSYELHVVLRSDDKPQLSWSSKDGGEEADRVFDLGIELMKAWMALRKARLPDPPLSTGGSVMDPGATKDG